MIKDELLQQIKIDRRQLDRYLFYFEKDEHGDFVPSEWLKFSSESMLQPGAADKLSVKDIVSLISGWEIYFIEWYNHQKFGERLVAFPPGLSWTDENEINQLILANKKRLSLNEVMIDFRDAF
jgi:hypothetical protein